MPTAAAPAANQSPTFSGVTPPVGRRRAWGSGARIARMWRGPPVSAGKILINSAPRSSAWRTSVGLNAPGTASTPCRRATSIMPGDRAGLSRNCAPASTAWAATSALVTVPAPTSTSGNRALRLRMTAGASGTVNVISMIPSPEAASASAASTAQSREEVRMMGTTLARRIASRTRAAAVAPFTGPRSRNRLGLPAVPVLGEEVEVLPPVRMRRHDVFIQGDAQPGPGGEREPPVPDVGEPSGRLLHERLGEVVEVLEDLEVRRRGGEVQRRRRAYRRPDVVRRHETPAGLGHRRDLLRFQQSAAVGDVGLDDLRRAEREQVPELGPRVQSLAGRNRDRDAARHLREGAGLVRGDRLLDPPRRQALEVARQRGGLGRGEPAVHFNEDLHIGPDGVADRLHEGHGPRMLGPL